jgi:hypothetical protein
VLAGRALCASVGRLLPLAVGVRAHACASAGPRRKDRLLYLSEGQTHSSNSLLPGVVPDLFFYTPLDARFVRVLVVINFRCKKTRGWI